MYILSKISCPNVIVAALEDPPVNDDCADDTKQDFETAYRTFEVDSTEKKRLYYTLVWPWKCHMLEAATIAKNSLAEV